jgi:hypothetical protein
MQQHGQSNDSTEDDPDVSPTASEDGSDDNNDNDYYHDDSDKDDYIAEQGNLSYSNSSLINTPAVLKLGTLLNGPQWQLRDPGVRRAARVDYRLRKPKKSKKPGPARERRHVSNVSNVCQ